MAKRSRTCEAFGVPSSSSNRPTDFEDQIMAWDPEVLESYYLFSGPYDEDNQSDSGDLTDKLLPASEFGSGIDPNDSSRSDLPIPTRISRCRLKATMESIEPSPGNNRSRGKSPVQEECVATGIRAKADDPNGIPMHIPGSGQSRLLSRPVTSINSPSSGSKGSSGCQSSDPTNFGMYAGRVKANPLKHLASVLQSKIQAHHEHRNLLEVATEIHDEAANKHNTTLRRIYDVVNVLDAAGFVERINGSSAAKNASEDTKETTETPSGSGKKKSSSKGGKGKDPADKRSARGSTIRWVQPTTEDENVIAKEALEKEKAAAQERILEKRRKLDVLTEELRVKTALINHNQNRYVTNYLHNSAGSTTVLPSARSEDDDQSSYSFLDLDDTSQTSGNSKSNQEMSESHPETAFPSPQAEDMQGDSPTYDGLEFIDIGELERANNQISEENSEYVYPELISTARKAPDVPFLYDQPANEMELPFPEQLDHSGTNLLPHEGGDAGPAIVDPPLVNGLRLPFSFYHTHEDNDVELEMDDSGEEVFISSTEESHVLDGTELLALMFPRD